jgi:choline dehydrogenase
MQNAFAEWTRTGTELDWGFATPNQPSLGNRSIVYHRAYNGYSPLAITKMLKNVGGKGFGGSSLVNGLTYGRGSQSVYDRWAALGNVGWDWKSVLPYFKKVIGAELNQVE